jgi:hypothetical protein
MKEHLMTGRKTWLSLFLSGLLFCSLAHAQDELKIDPAAPKYLLFRGKPLVLVTASEHYGSVINRPFDFDKYLADAAEHKMTMTRTFLLFRELQSPRNPSSPCKPESPDYISPFVRSGPGKAKDGEPIYDLDIWNPEYFTRLHRFLDAASQNGIVVELTVFSNTYSPQVWALNPFNAANNKQHVGGVEWEDYTSLKDPELARRQRDYARKIIDETAQYGNVYYEICNEPGGGQPGHATPADVDAWQEEMARVMRDEMRRLGRPHLLSGEQAFLYGAPNQFPQDAVFARDTVDIVNDHPLPNTQLDGHVYQLGQFMSKELALKDVADFCRAAYSHPKPTSLDEDNTASLYRDTTGWTIHRKRAWTALMNGCHYDYIDFSITVGSESGTQASRKEIRSWMQHLSELMSSFDFVHATLDRSWFADYPAQLVASGMTVSGHDYVAYLADSRELTDPDAGKAIEGSVSLSLPAGYYSVSFYSPVTGEYSPGIPVKGGAKAVFVLPRFTQDIVIRATLQDHGEGFR